MKDNYCQVDKVIEAESIVDRYNNHGDLSLHQVTVALDYLGVTGLFELGSDNRIIQTNLRI